MMMMRLDLRSYRCPACESTRAPCCETRRAYTCIEVGERCENVELTCRQAGRLL